jgi:uncharacterized protein YndB with AHSA1/START domain
MARRTAAIDVAPYNPLASGQGQRTWKGTIYDETDFREGGQDKFRCGAKSNPNIHGVTSYLDIALNRRIVSSETIVVDGKRLCVSLTTLELTPDGKETKLKSTTQLVSFIGQDMVNGHSTICQMCGE